MYSLKYSMVMMMIPAGTFLCLQSHQSAYPLWVTLLMESVKNLSAQSKMVATLGVYKNTDPELKLMVCY